MADKDCDERLRDLASFVHRKFPDNELRDRCKTHESREDTAVMLLDFYRTDPEFTGLMEPLVSATSTDSCRLSALRGSLLCLRDQLGESKYAGKHRNAVSA